MSELLWRVKAVGRDEPRAVYISRHDCACVHGLLRLSSSGYLLGEAKMLGLPRVRQVMVSNDSCVIPSDFQATIPDCYATYSSGRLVFGRS